MPTIELPNSMNINFLDERPAVQNTSPSPGSKMILLLHGLGADCSSWAFQIPALTAAGYRVLAVDTPGFGQSTGPRRIRSISTISSFIPNFLDRLGIVKVDVAGISMGGTMALQFALDHPDRINRLVLINTYGRLDISNPLVWPYYIGRFIMVNTIGLEAQAKVVAMRIFPHPDQEELRRELIRQILQVKPATYRSALTALAKFNVQARLSEIHLPTLIVTADQDTTVPLPVQHNLAAGITTARHVFISGAGHAVTAEKPEAFNQVFIDFLCA